MREIKAYIRRSRINALVKRLQEAGAPGITVVEVHPVGYGYEPNYFEPAFEGDVLKRYRYLQIVKLELVCMDNDLDWFIKTILHECQTGDRGDGWVFVSEVTEAIRIRDGHRGVLTSKTYGVLQRGLAMDNDSLDCDGDCCGSGNGAWLWRHDALHGR